MRSSSMPESVVHFQIRMPPQQHEKLASWAKEDKISLNLLVVGILEKAMERHKAEAGTTKSGSQHAQK
jgi:predicted HicB family RNase H-like nuclease